MLDYGSGFVITTTIKVVECRSELAGSNNKFPKVVVMLKDKKRDQDQECP